jgi:hypothetical protein
MCEEQEKFLFDGISYAHCPIRGTLKFTKEQATKYAENRIELTNEILNHGKFPYHWVFIGIVDCGDYWGIEADKINN